jgi:hypothetical protein
VVDLSTGACGRLLARAWHGVAKRRARGSRIEDSGGTW